MELDASNKPEQNVPCTIKTTTYQTNFMVFQNALKKLQEGYFYRLKRHNQYVFHGGGANLELRFERSVAVVVPLQGYRSS